MANSEEPLDEEQAVQYLRQHEVPNILDDAVRELVDARPADARLFLAQYLQSSLIDINSATPGGWKVIGVDGLPRLCHFAKARPGAIVDVPSPIEQGQALVPKTQFGCFPAKADKGETHQLPDVWAEQSGAEGVQEQMRNKVKKCAQCGKPNAFTLVVCNSCGAELPHEISYTTNLFMCAVYGFEAMGIAVRYQDDDCFVLDDLLVLSSAHFNAIWGRDWIPDVRWLFSKPAEGLVVLKKMREACRKVCQDQFEENPDYRKCMLRNGPQGEPAPPLVELAMEGMNYPPSQYQLHLQYIVLPMLPFQFMQVERGDIHYTKGRFYPIEWTLAALQKAADNGGLGFPIESDTKIEDIVAKAKEWGVDYDAEWNREYARCQDLQRKYGNWPMEKFEQVVVNGKLHEMASKQGRVQAMKQVDGDTNAQVAEDKNALGNYGKPTSTNCYKFAKRPGECKLFKA